MRRMPNHRFSVAKGRTVTPLESVLDSIKQHMPNSLKRTTGRQESPRGESSELRYTMGSKSKRGEDRNDLGDTPKGRRQETGSTRQSNGKRNQIRDWNEDWTSDIPKNEQDDQTSEGEGPSDAQAELDLDPYLARVKDLNMKLEASRTAVEQTLDFYMQHQLEIQKMDSTRQQLKEMTEECKANEDLVNGLKRFERAQEQKVAEENAAMEERRKEIENLKEEAIRNQQKLVEEKNEFEEKTRKKEADRLLQFQERKTKLESEQDKRYNKRVEDLEKEMKKSQDDDRKKISDLQAKNNELVQDLEKERPKLKAAERNYKDMEKLRTLSEEEAEMLSQKLKLAENEFGLGDQSTEYFTSEFLKIHNNVKAISERYVKQMTVEDLDPAVYDKIDEVDEDFISVPISNTIESKELCLVHFQRVISSQLQAILWQPFSSEITAQDSKQNSLLNQIYNGLAKIHYEDENSLRAARAFAALTIRSLHSQATSNKRTEIFTDNIMKVLSLLLNPKRHQALRTDLTGLATSAISLWNKVQTDQREIKVHPTLDPASFEKPEGDMDVENSRVFILFPNVTARTCSQTGNARHAGPPGSWVDSKPESKFEEICIYKGVGVPEWDQLVQAGENEKADWRRKQELESIEKQKRELEEKTEKLNKSNLGHKRGNSYSRRDSMVGEKSAPSSPTRAWLGTQKIPERE